MVVSECTMASAWLTRTGTVQPIMANSVICTTGKNNLPQYNSLYNQFHHIANACAHVYNKLI